MRNLLSIALLPLLCLSAASAQDPPKGPALPGEGKAKEIRLRYNFSELDGFTAEYRMQTILRQSKSIELSQGAEDARKRGQGSAVSTTRQTYTLTFVRGKRGKMEVELTPTRLEATIEENGQRTRTYDSKKQPQPPKGLEAMTERLHKTATLDVNRLGEVKRVLGVKPRLREAYRKNFHHFPSRELTIGKGWEDKTKQPIPPFGNLHYFTTFRLQEIGRTDEGLERYTIGAKILVTYEGVSPTESSKLEVTSQSGKGHLVVDQRGLLLEEKLESKVAYTITSTAGREHHVVESETVRWLTGIRKKGEGDEGKKGE